MTVRFRQLLFLVLAALAIALVTGIRQTAAQQDDSRLDPQLRQFAQNRLTRSDQIRTSGDKVAVLIRLREDSETADQFLSDKGIKVRGRIGDLVAAELSTQQLQDLSANSSIRHIHASHPRLPLGGELSSRKGFPKLANDAVNASIKAPDARSAFNVTGRNVVVGIVDSGIDFRHGDFLTSDGKTRIKALWDMSDAAGTGPNGVGKVYTSSEINSLLAGNGGESDTNGHGSQVAGTAAGNGFGTGGALPSGMFAGIAPEADLVIVKATRSATAQVSFYDDDIVAAMSFIRDQAAALNEPFVINLSIGSHFSSHDGNDPLEVAVDNLIASGNGRQVVVAAGNDGNAGIHAGGFIAEGSEVSIPFTVSSSAVGLLALYQAADTVSARIIKPSGQVVGPAPLYRLITSDPDVELQNAPGDTAADPKAVLVTLKNRRPGTWTLVLSGTRINNGRFDIWAQDGGETAMDPTVADNLVSVTTPATSRKAISVGNIVSKTAYVDSNGIIQTRLGQGIVGQLAKSSSTGPSRDGRLIPLIVAPGSWVSTTRSSSYSIDSITGSSIPAELLANDGGKHVISYGTSLSAAAVTGTVALMLQANPTLTPSQLRSIVSQSVFSDATMQPGPKSGYGRVNAMAAVQGALNAGTTRSFVSVSAASYNPETVGAPSSIMAGFGTNLSAATAPAPSLPLPQSLGGVSVRLTDSAGAVFQAPLFFVSPYQINYQLPDGIASGLAKVEVIRQDTGLAATGMVAVRGTWPGLFTTSADGQGTAAGDVLRISSTGARTYQSLSSPINLSNSSDTVYLELYGSGLRGRASQGDVSVTLGGTQLAVDYVGPQGYFVGLDQINVILPQSLAGRGRTLDLVVYLDGIPANTVKCTISL